MAKILKHKYPILWLSYLSDQSSIGLMLRIRIQINIKIIFIKPKTPRTSFNRRKDQLDSFTLTGRST